MIPRQQIKKTARGKKPKQKQNDREQI